MFLLILSLFFGFMATVSGHSWADCVDWRFTKGRVSWASNDGQCFGWARRFPIHSGFAFGDLDHTNPNRHYWQNKLPKGEPFPCSDRIHGVEPGSDELRATPPSAAYGTTLWGNMSRSVVPGAQMCIRWPANNHALDESAADSPGGNRVMINFLSSQFATDPGQTEFTKQNIASLLFGNCTDLADKCPNPGLKAHNSDLSKLFGSSVDPDCTKYIPCGGCFTVPQRPPGIYSVQWRWQLNTGEFYTSCWDVQVASKQSIPPRQNSGKINFFDLRHEISMKIAVCVLLALSLWTMLREI